MLRYASRAVGIALAFSVLAAPPAVAHHAINAQFDVTNFARQNGVLTKVEDLNPHTYWDFDIKNAQGQVQGWRFESGAPNALRRAGVRIKDDIKVGETYQVLYAPSRNGSRSGLMVGIVINGQEKRFVAN